jgi:conjugal transfer ATP-binding protein TraC
MNHNVFIAASSGGGKSFFVNKLAADYYGSGAAIRLIDIGGSYRKLAKIFNGRFIDFDDRSEICINPFSSVLDINNDGDVISAIVTQMIYSATDTIPVDNAETTVSIVKDAVKSAWLKEGPAASIDTVYSILRDFTGSIKQQVSKGENKALDLLGRNLAFNLREFTSAGCYGKWFNGPSTLDIAKDDFVVLELEHLKSRKDLFKVVTLQIINALTQSLYLSDRSRQQMIVVDEAWQFLRDSNLMGEIIEEGYRRARKYNGSFTVITQSIMDIKDFGRVGTAIMSNSAFKFFMESPSFEKAKAEKLIDYDPFVMDLLSKVRSNKPHYSEIFVDSPFGMGVARLVVDPFSYLVYTSDATEVSKIEEMVERGMTYEKAITAIIDSL